MTIFHNVNYEEVEIRTFTAYLNDSVDCSGFETLKEGVELTEEEEEIDKRVEKWLTDQENNGSIEGESNGI